MEARKAPIPGETSLDMVVVNIPATYTINLWLNSLGKEKERTKSRIMHKVPDLLANGNPKYYQPKLVPLGPYHKGNTKIKQFRRKSSMADKLIPDKLFQEVLRSEISSQIQRITFEYGAKTKQIMPDSEWEEMLFLDGCFVLYFIYCITHGRDEDLEMKRYEIDSVHKDLFLLENQLPYKLLKILSGNDPDLLHLVSEYICTHKIISYQSSGVFYPEDDPVHLLDCLHTIITSGHRAHDNKLQPKGTRDTMLLSTPPAGTKGPVLCHAKELITKGIHLKPNRGGYPMDISFKPTFIYGTLMLPKIIVDDSTGPLFLNLAAYEMCAGVGSVITSYICFLDSLVNHAEDIKELQSAGILINHLPTNEAAAKLFNEMSEGLRSYTDTYVGVKQKMQKFFEHKAKASLASWISECYHKHFKSPLTAMGVLAAVLALCLAATQTYFTVFPRGKN